MFLLELDMLSTGQVEITNSDKVWAKKVKAFHYGRKGGYAIDGSWESGKPLGLGKMAFAVRKDAVVFMAESDGIQVSFLPRYDGGNNWSGKFANMSIHLKDCEMYTLVTNIDTDANMALVDKFASHEPVAVQDKLRTGCRNPVYAVTMIAYYTGLFVQKEVEEVTDIEGNIIPNARAIDRDVSLRLEKSQMVANVKLPEGYKLRSQLYGLWFLLDPTGTCVMADTLGEHIDQCDESTRTFLEEQTKILKGLSYTYDALAKMILNE